MEKLCLDCSMPVKGRSDKKFCDDQCRTSYNNRLKQEDHRLIKVVNQILKKNRSIMEQLNPEGKSKAGKEKMINMGFDFNYFTSIYETQKGSRYFFCYEYGYLLLENNAVLLVKKEENTIV
ncbi:hypothetical protein GS399_17090 [Pedobacter sp. HMF7647]|uniref:DUF2116 family Zn-ribbon domain-containing protein n=1 Tax=Hufsiella arboris TaxID=2695275 RepID=A0A7K1YEA0_9SPHI|nr:hypothetical protein [Hufsiella arboris]MXV52691.1 hypothetical protein [Hufsiella arboris]